MKKIFWVLALMIPLSLAQAATQKVALRFLPVVGADNFACGKSYDGIGITKSRITPSDFRFYVSEVELIDKQGNAVPVVLDQDGVWQYQNLALLDFEDGKGACRNGNSGLHQQVSGTVAKGKYRGVRFTLGVPFELNHGDPTLAPSPLNLSAMFWAWQSGYKFVKIDMASNGQPQAAEMRPEGSMKERVAAMEKISAMKREMAASSAPAMKMAPRAAGYSVHLGSTACTSASLTSAPGVCKNPNRITVTFDHFDLRKNVIVADVAGLLRDTNVDVNAQDSAPGCMSAANDADCPGIFAAFGLPFNEQAAVAQRFFSVR